MNKILHIILAFLFCLTIISCGDDEEDTAKSSDNSTTSTSGSTETDNSSTTDTTAPVISEVTAVTTPTNDSTPDYTFSSSKQGQSHMEVPVHQGQHLQPLAIILSL